jgi:hypothetical protein
MVDLLMHEYGVGLSEVRRWTFGQIFMLLNQITARYEAQQKKAKKKAGTVELSEDRIEGSIWEKG